MKNKTKAFVNKCTKADLIWILEKASKLGGEFAIEQAVVSLEGQKSSEILKECDKINQESAECRRRYISLLEPYEGKVLADIPRNILQQASAEIDRAQELDKRWNKLMKMV